MRLGGCSSIVLVVALLAPACARDEAAACERTTDPEHSVARVWNEVTLDAIRRDFPAPTVHARNLFHVSAAMWDAWAAYDPAAAGYFVDEDLEASNPTAVREEAMSHAAYRILKHRYLEAVGADETRADLDATMAALCYPIDVDDPGDDDPAGLGARIAAAVLEFGSNDGALEADGYQYEAYEPVNEPLVVFETDTEMTDPNRWQPLAFESAETQNEIPLPEEVQRFVGPHWGGVTAFALPPSDEWLPLDPGPPPLLGDPATDDEFRESVVEVLAFSALLDPTDTTRIDIGPGAMGDNRLGANDGTGRDRNPVTGEPYVPNLVARADFGRVVAEFWADGPDSETPPGHWNTVANAVSDDPDLELRIAGSAELVDRLQWDVKLYFALNGAAHDAAVAAWGAKAYYDYSRPISMIRYMGGLGQSSDPAQPSYHPDGLPLVEGLIEVVTEESSAPGERHEHLDRRIGEMAVRAWSGNPGDPETEVGGIEWIRAVRWVPYQKETFVTPAFAAYVSGHSAFSRAAAEVLAGFTGSEYFPGGLGEWTIPAGSLAFEAGPEDDITLQWASYFDAADQAGLSRLYGGIHVRADDLAGRVMGATCGQEAWALAQRYYAGTVRS